MAVKETPEPNQPPETLSTIVFTDIVGSTDLTAHFGDAQVRGAMHESVRVTQELATAFKGRIIKNLGDGTFILFPQGHEAFLFAKALQRRLEQVPILVGSIPIRMRIGLHMGPIAIQETPYGGDAIGTSVNLAARVTSIARPGQIAVSRATAAMLALMEDDEIIVHPTEHIHIKSFENLIEIVRVDLKPKVAHEPE